MSKVENHPSYNKLILRDKLAFERTRLANRRTLLAFIRTAVAFFGGGLALVKIVDIPSFLAIGWVFMIASPVFLVAGIVSFNESNRRMEKQVFELEERLSQENS